MVPRTLLYRGSTVLCISFFNMLHCFSFEVIQYMMIYFMLSSHRRHGLHHAVEGIVPLDFWKTAWGWGMWGNGPSAEHGKQKVFINLFSFLYTLFAMFLFIIFFWFLVFVWWEGGGGGGSVTSLNFPPPPPPAGSGTSKTETIATPDSPDTSLLALKD